RTNPKRRLSNQKTPSMPAPSIHSNVANQRLISVRTLRMANIQVQPYSHSGSLIVASAIGASPSCAHVTLTAATSDVCARVHAMRQEVSKEEPPSGWGVESRYPSPPT